MPPILPIWQQIETWYAEHGKADLLNPGATEQAVAATEGRLGHIFPPDLRQSLLRHDGSAWMEWPYGELLSLERIEAERALWMAVVREGTFDPMRDFNADQDTVQPGWWNVGWIPLDADGSGNCHFMDLAPGPAGKVGQVRSMDHEVGPGVATITLAEYLEGVLHRLQTEEEPI